MTDLGFDTEMFLNLEKIGNIFENSELLETGETDDAKVRRYEYAKT